MIEVAETSNPSREDRAVKVKCSCADCSIADVCKYTEAYHHYMRELQESTGIPPVARVDLSCSYYRNTPNVTTKDEIWKGNRNARVDIR